MSSPMEHINKAPRWFLIVILSLLWIAVDKGSSYIFNRMTGDAAASTDKIEAVRIANEAAVTAIKPILYQAKNNAEKALEISTDLKIQIADVRGALETNRKEVNAQVIQLRSESREDNKDLMAKLDRVLYEVKK